MLLGLWGDLIAPFQYPKGSSKKGREGLFARPCSSDRMKDKGLKLKEGRFRLDIRNKNLYCEGGEALEQVAQRGCGGPIPGSV